jgi:hypothetical protein
LSAETDPWYKKAMNNIGWYTPETESNWFKKVYNIFKYYISKQRKNEVNNYHDGGSTLSKQTQEKKQTKNTGDQKK